MENESLSRVIAPARSDIYAMNNDGTDERRITRDPADGYQPKWTLNGTIVFLRVPSGVPDGFGDLVAVRPDTSELTHLTDEGEFGYSSISADGT